MAEVMGILARGAEELGIRLSDSQLEQFALYYREMMDWNSRMNLTSITGPEEVQVKHFLDSLTLVLAVPGGPAPGDRIMDVGTGAGLPGIPLKLAFPDVYLSLAESIRKKTTFLHHVVWVLDLPNTEVLTGRAEDLARQPDLREGFDLALARGLARLPVLAEYTLPFCRVGGKVVAWKHGGIEEEIRSAAPALKALGGRLERVAPVEVTGLQDNRILVVLEKTAPTPQAYPRGPGTPGKRPL